ncbi:MAG: alpha/beta hydrolase [Promicromonosporaceae bacterium]|nr:alpha/beta hydrolase [Promicromonosporaceae bacterium]
MSDSTMPQPPATVSPPPTMTQITANTVLPAHRTPVSFMTDDGVRLVGELSVPLDQPPVATLVLLHPLPIAGGSMDSHLFRKIAWRLPALAGMAVLRFNTRGTKSESGASEGVFGAGGPERFDVEAAVAYAVAQFLPRIWLVGWSFGTDLALLYGLLPQVQGAVLLSPPLLRADDAALKRWNRDGRPLEVLVPEFDDYLRPVAAVRRFGPVRQCVVQKVPGAGHLLTGEASVTDVLNEIVKTVSPGHPDLPSSYGVG